MFSLVVGKFCPLHNGHLYLIKSALAASERVCVLSYTSLIEEGCEPSHRLAWLCATLQPELERLHLHVLPSERCPRDDASEEEHRHFCADQLIAWGYQIDAVFSSETYGEGFASVLSQRLSRPVQHHCVDLQRLTYAVSGTQARALLKRVREASAQGRTQERDEALQELTRCLPPAVLSPLLNTHLTGESS